MKRLLILLPCLIFTCFFSIAQSSSPSEESPSFARAEFEEEVKPIKSTLDEFSESYRFPQPTSTRYDTLLDNIHGFEPDEVPSYSPAVVSRRLYELPTLIPMEYNSYVGRYIDVYTKQKRELTSRMLGLRRVYFPLFEEVLDRENMPIEIKYLSVVESALNPHARSRVGATGLWQFMLSTGRLYGLSVNSFVDERKDPYKSTEAACRYLKRSYEEFGDWLLAIASYNCGPGNVRKAIRRSGGKKDFWEIRRYLPRETRGYVPAFIAVNYVFRHYPDYNIYPVYSSFHMEQDTLHIRKLDITLAEIAKMAKTDLDELKYLNPELKLARIPYSSKPYVLRVQPEVASYFAQNYRLIYDKYGRKRNQAYSRPKVVEPSSSYASYRPKGTKLYYYRVKSGDVVGAIAERYGVSKRQIATWNNLYRYRIKVGQRLKIYAKPSQVQPASYTSKPPAQVQSSPPPSSKGNMKFHKVKEGENLWVISRAYALSLDQLKALNPGVKASNLKIGQTLRVR